MRRIRTRRGLPGALREALGVIAAGGVAAFPTETFYALGAKFDVEAALERVYELKGRPTVKSLPLIVGSGDALMMVVARVDPVSAELIRRHWPGPLTILLKAREGVSALITSAGKVAVRMPGESFALRLSKEAGFPITATSANPSGMPPASDADAVEAYFGGSIDLIVDGGATPGGRPSTIVEARDGEAVVLRPGAVEP